MRNELIDVQIPFEFVEIASQWYSGSASMLYAITSTGGLTIGTCRPLSCESDQQWQILLFDCLESELSYIRRWMEKNPDREESDDLDAIAQFEEWVEETSNRLRKEYNLEDWPE